MLSTQQASFVTVTTLPMQSVPDAFRLPVHSVMSILSWVPAGVQQFGRRYANRIWSDNVDPLLYIALADDWEVRGNGSGNPRVLQFDPMRRLMEILESNAIRGSFNVELMQQLTYRKFQDDYPELREIADEWDAIVLEAFSRGHDIQPHLHTQWSEPEYCGQLRWKLSGSWSMLDYSEKEMRSMIGPAIEYLQNLLRRVDPEYRCAAYRAGAWCAAPSDSLFPILAEFGIELDQSILAGFRLETRHIKLDFTDYDEDFLAYYPRMTDARRISQSPEPIVCLPSHSFRITRREVLARDLAKLGKKLSKQQPEKPCSSNGDRGIVSDDWASLKDAGLAGKLRKLLSRYVERLLRVSDLSQCDFATMELMLADIRMRAKQTGLARVPIILGNHTKDIFDFSEIERFIKLIANASDIKVITLSEMARGFRNGDFAVLTRARKNRQHTADAAASA